MPLDAVCLSFIKTELSNAIIGARIDKIHQPNRDEVTLSVRSTNGSAQLFCSVNTARARVQLSKIKRENPQTPPMFCMLLRKHLVGGTIKDIIQPDLERTIIFKIHVTNELGDMVEKKLIAELMGRHSNLILVDENQRILDCIRRVSETSSGRQVLPGMFYEFPQSQNKTNPLTFDIAKLDELRTTISPDKQMDKYLVDTFAGISPLIARELSVKVTGEVGSSIQEKGDILLSKMHSFFSDIQSSPPTPYILHRNGEPTDFSYTPILQYGSESNLQLMPSFSDMLDAFYEKKEHGERMRQKGHDLIRSVTTLHERISRKLQIQTNEYEESENSDALRQIGDIITSNLYCLEKGMHSFTTVNFYDPNGTEITIKLDSLLTPQQNAGRYYKKYNKAKNAVFILSEQIGKGKIELNYISSVLDSLSRVEKEKDLDEIRAELEQGGYLKKRSKSKKKMKSETSKPLEFQSSSGFRISVGKNNMQNDILTHKMAGRFDMWFHVQAIHGSHVILWTEGKEVDTQSMTEAAMIAVWYSQGKDGNKVPVDYTLVKHLRKPPGAKPGMVIYHTYETSYVTADSATIDSLKQ